jgi:hypothetical protein
MKTINLMKYLTLFLFLLITFSSYSQDADSLQAEKILAEAKILGEEGTKNQDIKKLREAERKTMTLINSKIASKAYFLIGDIYRNVKLMSIPITQEEDSARNEKILVEAILLGEEGTKNQDVKNYKRLEEKQ